MALVQRRGSSLELKIPSTQIVAQNNNQIFFGLRITVESISQDILGTRQSVSFISQDMCRAVYMTRAKYFPAQPSHSVKKYIILKPTFYDENRSFFILS